MTKHKVLEQAKTERKHYSPELKQGERGSEWTSQGH